MAYDTRSKQKSKEEESTSLIGKENSGKTPISPVQETPSLRRSTRERSGKSLISTPTKPTKTNSSNPPSTKKTNSSTPSSTTKANSAIRKSERLEKKSSPSSIGKRDLEKQEISSPLRRSKRAKDGSFATSSESSDGDESIASLAAKKKTVQRKSVVELTFETKQVDVSRKHGDTARKIISTDARLYRALFRKKPSNINVAGSHEECNARDKLSQEAQPNHGYKIDGDGNGFQTGQELLKDECTGKAGDGGLASDESLGCIRLVYEPSANEWEVDLPHLENGINGMKKATKSEDPNCSELQSDDATAKVITTDRHSVESPKELSKCNGEKKASQSGEKYVCQQQCTGSLDSGYKEVSPGFQCSSEPPNSILSKEGGERQEVDCSVDKNVSTLDLRNSTSREQLTVQTISHERCQSLTSSKRKASTVEIDAGISSRIVNEDACNIIASGTTFLDGRKMLHCVETCETCLKRRRVDDIPPMQEACLCDTKVNKEQHGPKKTKVSDLDWAPGSFPGFDSNRLDDVNKLRKFWNRSQNIIIIDDPDRIIKVVAFMVSVKSDVGRPFLIISTPASLSAWERGFFHMDPSMLIVSYNGNKEIYSSITGQEIYTEGGCKQFQVLLTTPQFLKEDQEVFERLGWEAVVVDECQYSEISSQFEQIEMLNTNMRLLLCGQLKDSLDEYVNLLSVLDSHHDRNKSDSISPNPKDAICILKERLSKYIAFGQKKDSSGFVEYWVPVHISNVQLEQYCCNLVENSFSLLSFSKSDAVGALHNLVISARKCCDHPYVVDPSLQDFLIKDHQVVEYLDIGIKASGKLQILDRILLEIKNQGMRVLILFQSIGSAKDALGDILDDFVAQKFGVDSYERVDKGVLHSKKLASLKMFNDKDSGRFIFLLERSACVPSIRLSSIDTVIIFNSDWNPLNDIKHLQKISIDSCYEKIKIFRLYSTFTVEEKVLILAKQDKTLDSQLQSMSRSTSHLLLMWGASYLFDKLTVFHDDNVPEISKRSSSEQLLINEVTGEFLSILSEDEEKTSVRSFPRIAKVLHNGTYHTDQSLFGERKIQVIDEGPPHIFWKTLFEGRKPSWRYASVSSHQRNRKKVQQLERSLKSLDVEADAIRKKKKKLVDNNVDHPFVKWGVEGKISSKSNKGFSKARVGNLCQPFSSAIACTNSPVLTNALHSTTLGSNIQETSDSDMADSEKVDKMRDAQTSLYPLLKTAITKLSDVLEFPDNAKSMANEFLEYVMNHHHVDGESLSVLQAFQLSVCWVAASLQKIKIDHNMSLRRAKQHLNFECKEEETDHVYTRLLCLKKLFRYHSSFSLRESARASDMQVPIVKGVADDHNEYAGNQDSSQKLPCHSPPLPPKIVLALKGTAESMKVIQKKCQKKIRKLIEKQQDEMHDFERLSLERMSKLEEDYKIESAVIRSCTPNAAVKAAKLKILGNEYIRKKEAIKCQNDAHLKDLQASQLTARQKLHNMGTSWVEEVKHWALVELLNVSPSKNPEWWEKYLKLIKHIQDLDSVKSMGHLSDNLVDQQSDSIVHERPGVVVRLPEVSETISSRGAIGISDHIELSHQQKGDCVDKANIIPNGTCENQNIVATTPSHSEGKDSAGVRVSLNNPSELVGNYFSNDDGEGSFQVSESSLDRIGVEHPLSSSPSAKGVLDCAESCAVHDKLPLGLAETPHPDVTAGNMSCVNLQQGEESMPCDGSILIRDPGTVFPNNGTCNMATDTPSSQMQSPGEILSLPNAEVALDNGGFVNSAGGCMDGAASVNSTSSSEQIADGTPATIPDKEEISRSEIICSEDGVENIVSLHLTSSKPVFDGATVNLVEAQNPGRTSLMSSSELVGHSDSRGDADMFLDNVASVDLHGERCRSTVDNPHLMEHTVSDSQSTLPFETSLENPQVYLYETLQEVETPSSLNNIRDADATVGERQSQLIHLACLENSADQSDGFSYQQGVREIETFSSVDPPVEQTETFPSANSLSSAVDQSNILSASGVQYDPCSCENLPNNITHTTVERVDDAAEILNLVAAEHATIPEPSSLGVASVAGVGALSEARSTLNTSANDHLFESAPQGSTIRPSLYVNPLENELERIQKEIDQAMKNHEDMKLRLRSDCDKAIEEAIAQIRGKYDVKLREIEGDYLQKRNALDTTRNAVFMHMILAEAFRSKCMDHKPKQHLGVRQDASRAQQVLPQLSRQQNAQRSPLVAGSTSYRPSATCLRNTRNGNPLTVPAAQVFSSVLTRPQVGCVPVATRIQSSCEVRAPAPHLQPSRPSASSRTSNLPAPSYSITSQPLASSKTTNLSAPPHGITSQQVPSNSALPTAMSQLATSTSPSTYQSDPQNRSSTLSALELPVGVDSRPATTMPNNLPGNSASSGGAPNIVCLSDDD